MFLYRRTLIREACLFNICNPAHRAAYNKLLAEEGRTVFIEKTKEWGTTGFVSPDFEAEFDPHGPPTMRYKDDAFYIYVVYDKTPDSPWQPPGGTQAQTQVKWGDLPPDPDHVVIDVEQATKPRRKKGG